MSRREGRGIISGISLGTRRGGLGGLFGGGRDAGRDTDRGGGGVPGTRRRVPRFRDAGAAVMLLPSLAGFTLFFLAPFCLALGYAFLDRPLNPTFVGLANFAGLFTNKAYLRGLFNTLRFLTLIVPLNMALSLGAALLLRRISPREGRRWWALVFLVPLVIPSGSMVFFWKCFFNAAGILNGWLDALFPGLTLNWLDSSLAFVVMALIFIWKNMGYTMILYLSALSSIPRDYYEAAEIDGAGSFAQFRYVTFPCLAPASVLTLTMSVINSFKIFREIYLVTGTYPHESIYTLQHFMNNMFVSLNYPKLTSATTVLTLFITVLTLLLLRWEKKVSL